MRILQQDLHFYFPHFAVIGEQSIGLLLDVRDLRINSAGKPFFGKDPDLLHPLPEILRKGIFFYSLVAVDFFTHGVP